MPTTWTLLATLLIEVDIRTNGGLSQEEKQCVIFNWFVESRMSSWLFGLIFNCYIYLLSMRVGITSLVDLVL